MVAPFPDFATAGGTAPTVIANNLFGHYTWMARWSEEITTDVDVDNKKFAQLVFVHCREFDNLVVLPVDDAVATAVISRFAADGLEWPTPNDMKNDFQALKAEAATLYAWTLSNVGTSIDYATLSVDSGGVFLEVPTITTPKPPALQTRVQALRNLFT